MTITAYDQVRYPNHPFPRATPARLGAIARLHGVPVASPRRCRVLEFGCGEASDLLPQAQAYPESTFLGVDLAPTALAYGEKLRDELGFHNLTLRVADLRDVKESDGPFDYILARGVFSWVPEDVRNALLDQCRRLLAPNGVAFVSYNARPGAHITQMLREMMFYHLPESISPDSRAEKAIELVNILMAGSPVSGPLGEYYKARLQAFLNRPAEVLFHDDLASINEPYSVSTFAGMARAAGLNYLGDVDYFMGETRAYPPEVRDYLDGLDRIDPVRGEQYRDFLHLRGYRQTLLVRAETPIHRPALIESIEELSVSGAPKPESFVEPDSEDAVWFEGEMGSAVLATNPLARSAMYEIAAQPNRPLHFQELITRAAERMGYAAEHVLPPDRYLLAQTLHDGFSAGVLTLELDPPTFRLEPGDRPVVSPLARAQLRAGMTGLTNVRQQLVTVKDSDFQSLIALCDGQHDRADFAKLWDASVVESLLNRIAGMALLME